MQDSSKIQEPKSAKLKLFLYQMIYISQHTISFTFKEFFLRIVASAFRIELGWWNGLYINFIMIVGSVGTSFAICYSTYTIKAARIIFLYRRTWWGCLITSSLVCIYKTPAPIHFHNETLEYIFVTHITIYYTSKIYIFSPIEHHVILNMPYALIYIISLIWYGKYNIFSR